MACFYKLINMENKYAHENYEYAYENKLMFKLQVHV